MGWDVVVFGELTLPGERMAKWKDAACDPRAFHDWAHDFDRDSGTASKVRDTILRLGKLEPGLGFVEVVIDDAGGRVRVRGHLTEDAYGDENRVLASLFRSAAPLGGRGSITFLGFETIDFGYRFDIAHGTSTMVVMDETMRREADASPEVAAIEHTIAKGLAEPEKKPAGMHAAQTPDEATAIAVVEKATSRDLESDEALVAKQSEAIARLGASRSSEALDALVAALARGARPAIVSHALIDSPHPEVARRVASALTPAMCKNSREAACHALRVLSKRLEIGDAAPVIAIFENPEALASKRFRESDAKQLREASARALVASGDATGRAAIVRAMAKHADAILVAIRILDVRARDAVLAISREPGLTPALRERIEAQANTLLPFNEGRGAFGVRV